MARIAIAAVLGVVLAHAASAQDARPKPKDIDLVLCLDCSGSMEGLISSAKMKLWDVVNELAKVKPVPNLRVGLYSFGNGAYAEKGHVRKELDLTTDLDEVYAKLNGLSITGSVEYVARVTNSALDELTWSKEPGALKIIFVAGNEPATQDPTLKLETVAAAAKTRGVIVNTIYCGNADNAEAADWSKFASLCGGKYATIDHNKAAQPAIATPYDKELTELGTKLNTTYVAYGQAGKAGAENQVAQDSNAANAAPAAAAARTISKAQALYRNSTWDLVDKLKEDPKFDIKTLKEDELSEELKKLKPEERMDYLKKKLEERTELQKKINDLGAKRAKFIEDAMKKQPKSPGEQALDEALQKIIREQAASKGFEVSKS